MSHLLHSSVDGGDRRGSNHQRQMLQGHKTQTNGARLQNEWVRILWASRWMSKDFFCRRLRGMSQPGAPGRDQRREYTEEEIQAQPEVSDSVEVCVLTKRGDNHKVLDKVIGVGRRRHSTRVQYSVPVPESHSDVWRTVRVR